MGEKSAYYIPDDQEHLIGKLEQLADQFWEKGIFLSTKDAHIYTRMKEYRDSNHQLPSCEHEFSYAEMGLADEEIEMPVPSNVYDAKCPKCDSEIYDEFTDALVDEDASSSLPDRNITCPNCSNSFPASETKAEDPGFVFARIYMWVSDIDDDDWEPSFKRTVESVLGPCKEIVAWDT